MRLSQGAGGFNSVSIDQMTDGATMRLRPAAISIRFKALCNTRHAVSLTSLSGGLGSNQVLSAIGGQFLGRVNYRAGFTWSDVRAEFVTEGTANIQTGNQLIAGAAGGDLIVNLVIDDSTNNPQLPLFSATYADMLVIRLSPQF